MRRVLGAAVLVTAGIAAALISAQLLGAAFPLGLLPTLNVPNLKVRVIDFKKRRDYKIWRNFTKA